MATDYKEYLATRVLTENQPVNYRLLSRAIQTHVNTAKYMLYDFYTKQNAKKPNSVHATYLLIGKKRRTAHTNGTNGVNGRNGQDTNMRSSPPLSSMPELGAEDDDAGEDVQAKTTIMLVREEEFEATKATFEIITSQHIYSLEPGPLENLNLLSGCNREVATENSSDDPLERWRLYGSIHNPYIKKRTAKFAPPTTAAPKATAKPTVKLTPAAQSRAFEKESKEASEDNTSGRSTPQPSITADPSKKAGAKPALRKEKSDIFKSFAKAKPKPKEPEKSKESTPAPTEDEPMQGMSEDEGDDEEIKIDHEKEAAARKVRADREEKLRKMMEEAEDEEMVDAPAEEAGTPMDTSEEKPAEDAPAGSEVAVTTEGGRRRGRRKVMKKKRVKDEEGYLVTLEEAVYESFSEDEPAPKKLKPAPKPSTAKGKNLKMGKSGQNSIASFFKKA